MCRMSYPKSTQSVSGKKLWGNEITLSMSQICYWQNAIFLVWQENLISHHSIKPLYHCFSSHGSFDDVSLLFKMLNSRFCSNYSLQNESSTSQLLNELFSLIVQSIMFKFCILSDFWVDIEDFLYAHQASCTMVLSVCPFVHPSVCLLICPSVIVVVGGAVYFLCRN